MYKIKSKSYKISLYLCCFYKSLRKRIKSIVKADNDLSTHEYAFNALRSIMIIVGCDSDSRVKDVTRLCFVSYDTDMYLNENC